MKKVISLLLCLGTVGSLLAQDPFLFDEQNGIVIMEAESTPDYGLWSADTTRTGYLGDNYLHYKGGNFYNTPGNSLLTYKIRISKAGKYQIKWRSRIIVGTSNTEHNDSWLRLQDASRFFAEKSDSILYPKGTGMTPNPDGSSSRGWFKVYQNVLNQWTWKTSTNDHNPFSIFAEFDTAGIYTLEVSGRSNGHAIDRIVLFHSEVSLAQATNPNLPESSKSILASVSREFKDLELFPNPVQDYLEIVLPPSFPQGSSTLRIRNISGQIMKQFTPSLSRDHSLTISLEDISAGLYFLIIETDQGIYRSKFVKQ